MAAQTVTSERDGRVMTVRLDNPPGQFMTSAMVRELDGLTRSLEEDGSVGAVVVTGAQPDVFITHFDVAEILAGSAGTAATVSPPVARGSLRAVGALQRIPGAKGALQRTPAAGALALRAIHDLFLRMNRSDKVWIAAINGTALGGGCELTLACDVRIMADGDHRIGLPEMSLGIIPGAGGTQRLARVLGPGQALEMMLEARALAPAEALGVGLVHRVVSADRLAAVAHQTAERLARRSPESVAALKHAVYDGASRPLAEGLHIERGGFLAAASTAAARRAMQAYAGEVDEGGGVAPWASGFERWQDGTAADLNG